MAIKIIRHGKKVEKIVVSAIRCPDCNSDQVDGRRYADGIFHVCNNCNCLWEDKQ